MKNIIIAFSGKARAGKSESAKLMKDIVNQSNEVKFVGFSFATKVKEIASYYFNWDGNKDIHTKVYATGDVKADGSFAVNGDSEVIQDKGRQLLINIGQKFREIRASIWADIVLQQIKDLDAGTPDNVVYCIDDMRFQNEAKALGEYGRFVSIRLNRPEGQLNLDDITEKDLDNSKFDYYIENDGSVENLKISLQQIYHSILKQYS
jgi:hypothetical protein